MNTLFDGVDAYPLSWPAGWERNPARRRKRAAFKAHSVADARDDLMRQMRLLGASSITLSTNLPLRRDGLPAAARRAPDDPAVAVYFLLDGQPRVLACDLWTAVEHNIWAIARHVEATRGQQRWGVGTLAQAFAGYPALPRPADIGWWVILQVRKTAPHEDVLASYRALVKQYHPDSGGNVESFLAVQAAWDAYLAETGRG